MKFMNRKKRIDSTVGSYADNGIKVLSENLALVL